MKLITTAHDPEPIACTLDGLAEHDYVEFTQSWLTGRRVWRCLWCHVQACGRFGELDPCWLPIYHRGPHRLRSGHAAE